MRFEPLADFFALWTGSQHPIPRDGAPAKKSFDRFDVFIQLN
jgi:hypothetical protein